MNNHRLDAVPAIAPTVVFVLLVRSILSLRLNEELLSSLVVGVKDLDHEVMEANNTIYFVQFRDGIEIVAEPVYKDRAP